MSQKIKREVIRITILGDQAVGKTTLRNVYLNIDFEENTLSTVGSNKSETKYKLEDGKEIKLFLYETAGQERFRSIALKSVKNSQGVMLVFDVTNKKYEKMEISKLNLDEKSISTLVPEGTFVPADIAIPSILKVK